jgi:hypothetical protein
MGGMPMRGIDMICKEVLERCGLVVRRDGRIARAGAAGLIRLLTQKIDARIRYIQTRESKIGEQQAEISRLKAELEEERRSE